MREITERLSCGRRSRPSARTRCYYSMDLALSRDRSPTKSRARGVGLHLLQRCRNRLAPSSSCSPTFANRTAPRNEPPRRTRKHRPVDRKDATREFKIVTNTNPSISFIQPNSSTTPVAPTSPPWIVAPSASQPTNQTHLPPQLPNKFPRKAMSRNAGN